jgi:two-component system chemotaxis sensor kinase CheA
MTDDLLQHFIVEARELVEHATDDLLALERDPADTVRLDSAFRAVHTLKGSVGLFDFAPMGQALHAGEDLLSAVRAGRAAVDGSVIDVLLECIVQTERWVGAIERTGHLPSEAPEEGRRLAEKLRSRLEHLLSNASPVRSSGETDWAEALLATIPGATSLAEAGDAPLVAIRYVPRSDCFFAGDDPMALLRSVPELVAVRVSNRDPWPPVTEFDPFSCNLSIEALSAASVDEVRTVFRFVPDQVSLHEWPRKVSSGALDASSVERGHAAEPMPADGSGLRNLRVDASRIDTLADLVGELVIAKNALAHLATQTGEGPGGKQLAQDILSSQAAIDRLVSEMHRSVMDIRMLPLSEIFRRFPRAVREISARLGKSVDFSMEGERVEADKSIVEGLFEPLLHVVRNAVDHGAEPESARLEAGKRARAGIVLRARREGDQVVIEVEDDGRGIDPAKIREVARERNLLAKPVLDGMTDAEVQDLVFVPGFSTATEVTDVSGRGVGMDAVRAAVEKMGGRVGVRSTLGRGTTLSLFVPLTVVMTKIMTVRVGGERYGIPLDEVAETAFVPSDRIIPVRDAEAFVLRDRTIPLIQLADLLDVPRAADTRSGAKVVVVSVADDLVGIAVDGFAERMDVLMRPMTGILAGVPGVVGTTLLGDGSVLMIVDIPELLG